MMARVRDMVVSNCNLSIFILATIMELSLSP